MGANPGLEWPQRIKVDGILWQRVPEENAGRVERVLIATDMVKWLNETLRVSSSCCCCWMEKSAWQVDQVWHHTEHHDCPSPESSLLKVLQLKVAEQSRYTAFLLIVSSDEPCSSVLNSLYCIDLGLVGMIPNDWGILQLWTNQAFVTGGSDLAGAGWPITASERNRLHFVMAHG